MTIVAIDIGGTKCAVSRADENGCIRDTQRFATSNLDQTLHTLFDTIDAMQPGEHPVFGVSCGSPLDEKAGLILSPPNLPGWDNVPLLGMLLSRFGGHAYLMNDANAGALAEWRYGAGQGTDTCIFITFGTGLGAGLILNGRLYEGASGMAGEIGHIRLASDGPVGYEKPGSFEGFCSGGGIARTAQQLAAKHDGKVSFNPGDIKDITTKHVAEAAKQRDPIALSVFEDTGRRLGQGLAIVIDILNPEVICLGGVFARCEQLLTPAMMDVLQKETLPQSLHACSIVPAMLGESIGDYAAICVALHGLGRL